MRATEILNEMPYLYKGGMPQHILSGGISTSTLASGYTPIGTVHEFPIYKDRYDTHVLVVDPTQKDSGGELTQVFRMDFKRQPRLAFPNNFQKLLQVNKVAVDSTHGARGIASSVYKLLVNMGYTIVSDDTQYEPAQALWRRLAADPNTKVYVADKDRGILTDNNGDPIVYTGTNIPDQDIWTGNDEYSGRRLVLILTR